MPTCLPSLCAITSSRAFVSSVLLSLSLTLSLIEQFQWIAYLTQSHRPQFDKHCRRRQTTALSLWLPVAAATTFCRHTNTNTSLPRLVGHCVWPLPTTASVTATTATTTAFARFALLLRFSFSLALLACGSQFATLGSICLTISPLVRSTTATKSTTTTNELAAGSSSSNKQMSAA